MSDGSASDEELRSCHLCGRAPRGVAFTRPRLHPGKLLCAECAGVEAVTRTWVALLNELQRAREKFPRNRRLLVALMEEVGELARAYLQRQGRERVREEAIQVACVAVRIFEEGDSDFNDVTDEEARP